MTELAGPRPPAASLALIRTLIAEERSALLMRARRLCRNEADAQDLVQSTASRALERADRFHGGDRGRSWLFTILTNLFIDKCRRDTVAPDRVVLDEERMSLPAEEPEPEPAYARVTAADLQAALDAIDAPSRQIFELFEVRGKSYLEIGQAVGIPKNTVGTRLLRTRHKLKHLLLAMQNAARADGGKPAAALPRDVAVTGDGGER